MLTSTFSSGRKEGKKGSKVARKKERKNDGRKGDGDDVW